MLSVVTVSEGIVLSSSSCLQQPTIWQESGLCGSEWKRKWMHAGYNGRNVVKAERMLRPTQASEKQLKGSYLILDTTGLGYIPTAGVLT